MDTLVGIDIFSGAGGLSLGAEMAGIQVKCAIEKNESAVETFKNNHKKAHVFSSDIQAISSEDVLNHAKNTFIIMGGPPCQGFSLSNTRTRNMDNPNNMLFTEFVRLVKDIQPKWFLFENVWGITNINNGEVMNHIKSCFEELGYKVVACVLKASNYGVPQNRERFFMVGNRWLFCYNVIKRRGCIKNKLFDTLFLYIAIESAKIIKRPIFGDFPKIFDSRGV